MATPYEQPGCHYTSEGKQEFAPHCLADRLCGENTLAGEAGASRLGNFSERRKRKRWPRKGSKATKKKLAGMFRQFMMPPQAQATRSTSFAIFAPLRGWLLFQNDSRAGLRAVRFGACRPSTYPCGMESSAIIKSAHDGTSLELFDRGGGYFLARLVGPNLQGTAKVYEYVPVHLKAFFDGLAANWQGWPGKRQWGSLEGELSLSATIDSSGHIMLSVEMRSGSYPFDWRLSAMILVEVGQLDRLAASVGEFLTETGA